MVLDAIFTYALEHAPTVVAVGAAVWYITKRSNKRELQDARLTESIDGLGEKFEDLAESIKHQDGRLNEHDVEIALLKQKVSQE